jgi:isopentenyldiphosphate isomerase
MAKKITTTTDPQGELITQVDEHNQIIGSISRGRAHETPGVYYRTIYVLVKNDRGEVLIQKRSTTKDLYPNCWDLSVGGHVNFGQSYEETAARELSEELGLDVSEKDLNCKGEVLVRLPNSGEYFKVFEYSLKPGETVSASEEEINDTGWMTVEDIKKSMADKTLQWYERPEQIISALY